MRFQQLAPLGEFREKRLIRSMFAATAVIALALLYVLVRAPNISPLIVWAEAVMAILALAALAWGQHISEKLRVSQHHLKRSITHDQLTGLAARPSLDSAIDRFIRSEQPFALIVVDLDGFEAINKNFGHPAADDLLRTIAGPLARLAGSDGCAARLASDEFAIVVSTTHQANDSETLATAIVNALAAPISVAGTTIRLSGSVGLAAISDPTTGSDALRRAHVAMRAAKRDGGNGWRRWHRSMDADLADRQLLEAELRDALHQRAIAVVFQPVISSETGRIASVEALARWSSPTLGPIAPTRFIAIAEQTGLIVELGRQILRRACRTALDWDIRLSVNLSPAQFWHQDLVDDILATLEATKFPADRLELEITESYLLPRPDEAARIIDRIRSHNIRVSLDDFGAGFASIGFLRRFNFDKVKLDRSLIDGIGHDREAASVLSAVVALGHALHLPVTAEGVETQEQADLLRAAGCEHLQGWLFGKPFEAGRFASIAMAADR